MPDFKTMVKALKLTWIKRLIVNDNNFTRVVKAITGIPDFVSFFKYKQDIKYINNYLPSFYKQIIEDWFNIYSEQPITAKEIITERLWLNKFILIDHKPCHYKDWQKCGIETINDILTRNGSLKNLEQLRLQYNITPNILNTMKYNSLKSAIPKKWLSIAKSSIPNYFKYKDTIEIKINETSSKCIEKMHCKDFYKTYITKKVVIPTATKKWEQIYSNHNFEWESIYYLPYKINRETSLQSLHYKIINRYIPCKENLFKWKKVPDPSCPDCAELDTIEHFFFSCQHLQSFWKQFFDWWKSIYSSHIQLSKLDIIFGIANENADSHIDLLNFCVLFIKGYINDCKLYEKTVSFKRFKKTLFKRVEIEKHILLTISNTKCFDTLWRPLYQALC